MKYDAPKEFKILSTILTSTGGNSTYSKVAVQCSVSAKPRWLMIRQWRTPHQSRLSRDGKNTHLRKSAKRYV